MYDCGLGRGLSQDSAGIAARFVTDAPELHCRWSLRKPSLAMVHMPATGVSGVDLYCRTPDGDWRWVKGAGPTAQDDNCVALISVEQDFPPGEHEFLVRLLTLCTPPPVQSYAHFALTDAPSAHEAVPSTVQWLQVLSDWYLHQLRVEGGHCATTAERNCILRHFNHARWMCFAPRNVPPRNHWARA